MKRELSILFCAAGALAGCTETHADPGAPDITVLAPQDSIQGQDITAWTKAWWRWTFAVPADQNPELVLEADCGTGQSDPVFFVPAYDGAKTYKRTCRVPADKPVLVPLRIIINDYPCPDESFKPAPGQPLEDFLVEGAVGYNDLVQNLTVTLDGEKVVLGDHRHTTGSFDFTADPSLVGKLPDPCLTGTSQPGASDGWWLMLTVARGEHVVHVTGVDPEKETFDYTYKLSVAP